MGFSRSVVRLTAASLSLRRRSYFRYSLSGFAFNPRITVNVDESAADNDIVIVEARNFARVRIDVLCNAHHQVALSTSSD
jgi:hypothetical protein